MKQLGNLMHVSPVKKWSLKNRLTLGIVALSFIGVSISDFAAISALHRYLIHQVDVQLTTISNATIIRLDHAGIDPRTKEGEPTTEPRDAFHYSQPLREVPTDTSVTLLDNDGNLLGQLGGDLGNSDATPAVIGLTSAQIIKKRDKPFTIKRSGGMPNIRVYAALLPSGLGSVVMAKTLTDLDRTLSQLAFLFVFIGIMLIIMVGLLSRWIIDLSLKPLHKVEETAHAFASGDFTARLSEASPGTEVGNLTESLNAMLERIEESFAARSATEDKLRRFVADASHELRTPIAAIRGFAELHEIGAVQGEEKTSELIKRIENESIRMGTLVDDLLLLARLDQARSLKKEPIELVSVITEAVASARAAGPHHPISWEVPEEEIYILGDESRLHQVLANLLSNARIHTPAGTTIEVGLHQSDDETTITVSDNGPGISEEDQQHIFERFFRVDESRVRSVGEGSGLGLSIVDAVIKAHDGTVHVESKVGVGTTFTIHLPLETDNQ